jgi:hypothetical protein
MSTFGDLTPNNTIEGASDGTMIGNIADALKVNAVNFPLDSLTGSILTIEHLMAMIHAGNLYSHAHVHTLANGDTYYHLLITPALPKRIHYLQLVNSSGPGTVTFLEGPTVSANGSEITGRNHERNVADANTTFLIYHAPTVTAEGTSIVSEAFGSNGGQKQGGTAGFLEFVLKPETKYLIKYTSSASANAFSEYHYWYEPGSI